MAETLTVVTAFNAAARVTDLAPDTAPARIANTLAVFAVTVVAAVNILARTRSQVVVLTDTVPWVAELFSSADNIAAEVFDVARFTGEAPVAEALAVDAVTMTTAVIGARWDLLLWGSLLWHLWSAGSWWSLLRHLWGAGGSGSLLRHLRSLGGSFLNRLVIFSRSFIIFITWRKTSPVFTNDPHV